MLLFPRKPLDVSASLYCPTPEQALYDTSMRVLKASTTRRPYTAAVIRQGLRGKELEAYQSGDKTALQIAKFLKPVQAALRDWWATQPHSAHVEPSPLQEHGEIYEGGIGWHLDQVVEDEIPVFGPLSTTTTTSGESTYYFKTMPKDVWNPDHTEEINDNSAQKYSAIPKTDPGVHTIKASPGDVVIFSQIPPTWHGVEASAERTAAIYSMYMRAISN
jgi:hypothetical protein